MINLSNMGIRGLTTYISRHSDKYLDDYKLRDCHLVIDGNSLMSQLYVNLNVNCAFGGDYDKYADNVLKFFSLLRKCNVKPLVIFDGGYERHKLCTVLSRMKEKVRLAKFIAPHTHQRKLFPALLNVVFKGVLQELGIPFAQCLFEADEEVAAIARYLGCPVLSYDSDFFVYDVLYIPFPTLGTKVYKDENEDSCSFYLSCRIYRVESFLKQYGGLQKELLPLLAILLGNDYIRRSIFRDFISHLKRPKSRVKNDTQRNIAGLLEWLRNETLETATSKVMNRLKKKKRGFVAEKVNKIISLYMYCTSELLPVLRIENDAHSTAISDTPTNVDTVNVNADYDDENVHESTSEEEQDSGTGGDDTSKVMDNDNDETRGDVMDSCVKKPSNIDYIPEWFISDFRQGKFPSAFMDMITLHSYFIPPQVEDYQSTNSHTLSFPLIGIIYGLLNITSENSKELLCYTRETFSSHRITVSPIFETSDIKFPSLHLLPELSSAKQMLILFEAVGLTSMDQKLLLSYPRAWRLYILSIVFWVRHSRDPTINTSHVCSVVLCLLALDVIKKAGVPDSKTKLGKNKDDVVEKEMSAEKHSEMKIKKDDIMAEIESDVLVDGVNYNQKDKRASSTINSNAEFKTDFLSKDGNIKYQIKNEPIPPPPPPPQFLDKVLEKSVYESLYAVSAEECILLKDVLKPWHNVEEKLKTCPKLYCVTTVHSFAQLQSCFLHIIHLNALLGYPLMNCQPAYFYSGTFLYNAYHNLIRRSDVLQYITQLFAVAPSIIELYKSLCNSILCLLPDIVSVSRPKRKTHRKKPKHDMQTNVNAEEIHIQSSDTDYEDINNRFATLNLECLN